MPLLYRSPIDDHHQEISIFARWLHGSLLRLCELVRKFESDAKKSTADGTCWWFASHTPSSTTWIQPDIMNQATINSANKLRRRVVVDVVVFVGLLAGGCLALSLFCTAPFSVDVTTVVVDEVLAGEAWTSFLVMMDGMG